MGFKLFISYTTDKKLRSISTVEIQKPPNHVYLLRMNSISCFISSNDPGGVYV